MSNEPQIELSEHVQGLERTDAEPRDRVVSELKPADHGYDAWRLLIAAFVFEALFWGTLLPGHTRPPASLLAV
jgi:hypothetical protein